MPDPSGPSLTKGWHDYGVLWTPTSYTYFLDGKKVWTATAPVSQIPEHVRLTCEIRNNSWAGSVPVGGYPARVNSPIGMDVSRVRYFTK
jgi:beta-glucanase (GH16 family)